MPLLGKRKYINEKIENMINKLDDLGYDTTEVKNRFYEIQEEQEDDESAGRMLPYRKKIDDVLNMIDKLINGSDESDEKIKSNESYTEEDTIDTPSKQFKQNLINTINDKKVNNSNSFDLF